MRGDDDHDQERVQCVRGCVTVAGTRGFDPGRTGRRIPARAHGSDLRAAVGVRAALVGVDRQSAAGTGAGAAGGRGNGHKTPPVEIPLVKGKNVLRFTRNEPVKGLTIKDFTLTPVK